MEISSRSSSRRTRLLHRVRHANIIGGAFGFAWLAIVALPLYYVVITSFKGLEGFFSTNALVPTSSPTIDNYTIVVQNDILQYFSNSIIVAVGTVVPTVALAFMAAYGVVRSRSRIATGVNGLILLGMSIPLQATAIPIYFMISRMGMYDTLWALIVPAVAVSIPVSFLILSNSMRNIPRELFESMRLDGCSEWSIMWRLALPLTRPAVMTVSIYETVRSWNAFLLPLLLTQSTGKRTVPLSLWSYRQDEFAVNTPAMLAAIATSVIPLLLFYIFGRKQLVGGLTAGFTK